MNKDQFKELLQRYFKGLTTEEENRYIISYYNLFESGSDADELPSDDQKKAIKQEISDRIWKDIHAKDLAAKGVISSGTLLKVAAAVCAIAFASMVFYLSLHSHKTESRHLTIINQLKESRLIHLSDGSIVILKIGAKLDYPDTFAATQEREVYLEGEAYFDIAHSDRHHFIVHTGKLHTTVIGTAFNIKALPGDNNITVTVTRGKVRISDADTMVGLVSKGQEIIYNKTAKKSVQKTFTMDANVDWKKQDIFFDDVTVEDAAKLLEDRFEVKIFFNDTSIKTKRFTTVFLQSEGLDAVLKGICEFNNATYDYFPDKAAIIIKKHNSPTN